MATESSSNLEGKKVGPEILDSLNLEILEPVIQLDSAECHYPN